MTVDAPCTERRRTAVFAVRLVAVTLAAAATSGGAADPPGDGDDVPLPLANLREKYDAAVNAQIADLQGRYLAELNALRSKFRTAGRADAVALVDREIRDLERERDALRKVLADHVWGVRAADASVAVTYGGRLRVIDLESGTPYALDRDYRITEVPGEMGGLKFTSLKAYELLPMRVTVTEPGRLWLLLDSQSYEDDARQFELDGWRRADPVKTDDKMGAFIVLQRQVRKGESLSFEPREWLSVGLAAAEITSGN